MSKEENTKEEEEEVEVADKKAKTKGDPTVSLFE